MDCEKLSPNALKIFERIKKFYPPDPWDNPQWTEEGRVNDNGWRDLRKKADRDKLMKKYEHVIGFVIVASARSLIDKKEKLTRRSVFNLKASRGWIELACLLYDLDFQIETLDLVES